MALQKSVVILGRNINRNLNIDGLTRNINWSCECATEKRRGEKRNHRNQKKTRSLVN